MPAWATREIEPVVIVPWELTNQSQDVGREGEEAHSRIDPALWTLATSSIPAPPLHSRPSPYAAMPQTVQENPNVLQRQVQSSPTPSPLPLPLRSIMAFQRADPRPFIPRNLQWQEVENHVPVVHVVASSRPPAQNEDLAIVIIDPLPSNAIHFPTVDEVL